MEDQETTSNSKKLMLTLNLEKVHSVSGINTGRKDKSEHSNNEMHSSRGLQLQSSIRNFFAAGSTSRIQDHDINTRIKSSTINLVRVQTSRFGKDDDIDDSDDVESNRGPRPAAAAEVEDTALGAAAVLPHTIGYDWLLGFTSDDFKTKEMQEAFEQHKSSGYNLILIFVCFFIASAHLSTRANLYDLWIHSTPYFYVGFFTAAAKK
jgi:hypothetical protein